MDSNNNSRRKFITTSAIGLTGLVALGSSAFGRKSTPTDIIRLGMIGTGARGVGLATLIKQYLALLWLLAAITFQNIWLME